MVQTTLYYLVPLLELPLPVFLSIAWADQWSLTTEVLQATLPAHWCTKTWHDVNKCSIVPRDQKESWFWQFSDYGIRAISSKENHTFFFYLKSQCQFYIDLQPPSLFYGFNLSTMKSISAQHLYQLIRLDSDCLNFHLNNVDSLKHHHLM